MPHYGFPTECRTHDKTPLFLTYHSGDRNLVARGLSSWLAPRVTCNDFPCYGPTALLNVPRCHFGEVSGVRHPHHDRAPRRVPRRRQRRASELRLRSGTTSRSICCRTFDRQAEPRDRSAQHDDDDAQRSVAANGSGAITRGSDQPASSGLRLRARARHSQLSSSVESCSAVSAIAPAADIGLSLFRLPG